LATPPKMLEPYRTVIKIPRMNATLSQLSLSNFPRVFDHCRLDISYDGIGWWNKKHRRKRRDYD